MEALIVYDSTWGNTEQIARAIASGIGGGTKVCRAGDAESKEYDKIDLLVLGSPVHGGRPSEAMQRYINGITQATARNLSVATFDTRVAVKLAKIFGYAAVRMADQLKEKGSTLKAKPEGFIVKGRSGPLAEGELERAAQWGKELANPCI